MSFDLMFLFQIKNIKSKDIDEAQCTRDCASSMSFDLMFLTCNKKIIRYFSIKDGFIWNQLRIAIWGLPTQVPTGQNKNTSIEGKRKLEGLH